MKKIITYILIVLLSSINVTADEGMWLPHLLEGINEKEMHSLGMKLTTEDIYSINKSSLKDAIVSLGGFCTAEMISDQGLMLTNHHCAFDVIQNHSSLKNDYIKDGFWAMNKSEELSNESLTASFLISIKDVSKEIISELSDTLNEAERNRKITILSNKIIEEATKDTHYSARVKAFYGGNNFYLLKYETFQDVRLVGAPPSSIGKFGGDTDNWMWPRHTGDFALFRVYCGPDGKPAEYSIENVPYKPKHHLPIQAKGVNNNDFTMVFGFPGSTDRYLTSYGVKQALEIKNPTIVDIRDEKLSIMKSWMNLDKEIEIKYAAKYAQTSNYWKYYIGQSKGLKRMKVHEKKQKTEDEFMNWINKNEEKRKKYGDALSMIKEAYNINKNIAVNRIFLNEAIFMGSEIMYFSFRMNRAIGQLPEEKDKRLSAIKEIKKDARNYYKDYSQKLDKELFGSMLELYYYTVPEDQHAPIFKTIENQLLGFKKLDFQYYAETVFNKSVFSNEEKFMRFLESPSISIIKQDPAYKTLMSIYNEYIENISSKRKEVRDKLKKGNRLFIAGLKEMSPEKNFYPNANSTMRLTYGNVGDYIPADGVHYNYFTTIDGIMEKEDPLNEEFIVPVKLKELYNEKNYGEYADAEGNLRVNFISNNDITGGNSGSPVINAMGELVGCAFDGNWEAMSGDIAFENQVQRTISVDIRYILFIIDKFANAGHLIDEMTIASENNTNKEEPEIIEEKQSNIKNKQRLFKGEMIPVINYSLFEDAFRFAYDNYGVNKKFWWGENVYITNKR